MLLRRSTMKVFASWSPTSRYVRCRSGNKNMNSLWNQSFMQLNLHGSVVYMGGYMLFEKDEMYIYNLSTHPMYILFEASQALIHICRDMLKFRTLAWSAGCFSKIKVNADHKSCFGFWSRYREYRQPTKERMHVFITRSLMRMRWDGQRVTCEKFNQWFQFWTAHKIRWNVSVD